MCYEFVVDIGVFKNSFKVIMVSKQIIIKELSLIILNPNLLSIRMKPCNFAWCRWQEGAGFHQSPKFDLPVE